MKYIWNQVQLELINMDLDNGYIWLLDNEKGSLHISLLFSHNFSDVSHFIGKSRFPPSCPKGKKMGKDTENLNLWMWFMNDIE